MEHSSKHHFGTQPCWHSFRTQNATSHQTTAKKTDIRFTDKRSTLEGSRVPKRCLYQKTTPMRDLVLTSSLPLSWLLLLSDLGIHYGQLSSHLGFIWGRGRVSQPAIWGSFRGEHSTYIIISATFKGWNDSFHS